MRPGLSRKSGPPRSADRINDREKVGKALDRVYKAVR